MVRDNVPSTPLCERASGDEMLRWPITDKGVALGGAFDSDTATGLLPIAQHVATVLTFRRSRSIGGR